MRKKFVERSVTLTLIERLERTYARLREKVGLPLREAFVRTFIEFDEGPWTSQAVDALKAWADEKEWFPVFRINPDA